MNRRKIGLFTFIAAVWLFSVCAIYAQDTNFAFRLPCELQTAGPASLVDLNWQQGTTPHIGIAPMKLGRPLAVDPLTSVRMVIGQTKTSTNYVQVTNWLATNSVYYCQFPTIGTNTGTNAWFYTAYFSRAGYDYWTGSGRLYIEETTSTGTNGLIWQEITAGAAIDTVARADASNAYSAATNALAVAESAASGTVDSTARSNAAAAQATALGAWASASNATPAAWSAYPATNNVVIMRDETYPQYSQPISFRSDWGGGEAHTNNLYSALGGLYYFKVGQEASPSKIMRESDLAGLTNAIVLGTNAEYSASPDGTVIQRRSVRVTEGGVSNDFAVGAIVNVEGGGTATNYADSGGVISLTNAIGGSGSGSGFPLTNNADAARFAFTNSSLVEATTGRFSVVSGDGANVTNLAGGTVAQDLTLSQDLIVNGNLLVQGTASNVVWTYVDYRTNVYGGTVTNFYTENVYSTQTLYTYTTNYAVSETTQTVNQIVNVGGFIDARLASWSALPLLTISNGTATATGGWDFAGATVTGISGDGGATNLLSALGYAGTYEPTNRTLTDPLPRGIANASIATVTASNAMIYPESNAWWRIPSDAVTNFVISTNGLSSTNYAGLVGLSIVRAENTWSWGANVVTNGMAVALPPANSTSLYMLWIPPAGGKAQGF